jgi:hypothetical protein
MFSLPDFLPEGVMRWLKPRPLPPLPPVPTPSLCPQPTLAALKQLSPEQLPDWVRHSEAFTHYWPLLRELDWANFPERPENRPWPGKKPRPRAPYAAAYLIKLDKGLPTMGKLRAYLLEQPALVWLLGFPLHPDPAIPWGFDVQRSVPTRRQFNRVLRELGQPALQFLLTSTVRRLQEELPPEPLFAETVSLDTKAVIAWVKENNPKAYIKEGRYDKTRQPAGDKDCKLGVKRRSNQNQRVDPEQLTTPPQEGQPAQGLGVGKKEFYWGYASATVATKIEGWGEFVVAELTQTFDRSDISSFFPLMNVVEARLGRRPRFGALDAAYDASYIYDYFHQAGGFAAVPLNEKGWNFRQFDAVGRPLCEAGLGMPLKFTYQDRTSLLIPHERGRYVCPLFHPEPTGESCPRAHEKWAAGGCATTIATSVGARLRHQLDRESAAYREVYRQRTADERINSQAVALGIERPKLRNQRSIANYNTLIYVLINLRAVQRVQARKAALLTTTADG